MPTPPCWIDLDGAVNVRDLAGLTAGDGRAVRPGRLIRADNLQDLSPADVRRLVDELGVRTVVDLRTTVEVDSEGPGPILAEPDVTVRHLSLVPEEGERTDVAATDDEAADQESVVLPWQGRDRTRDDAAAAYLRYLDDRGPQVIEALRAIAHGDGATLVHCAAGKDRTGTVVALALAAAGVDRDAILADYAASAERIEAILTRLIGTATYTGDLGRSLDEVDVDRQRPRAETMGAFLDALDERYGGAGGWLAGQGWSPEDDRALRTKLLT